MAANREVMRDAGGSMDVSVGASMLIKFGGVQGDFKTEVVGVHGFDFMILKFPAGANLRDKLFKGQEVVVRYLNEGVVYGFRSSLLNFVKTPSPLLFIDFPSTVEKVQLRKAPRISCLILCNMYCEKGEFHGFVLDLSQGGCRVNALFKGNKGLETVEPEDHMVLDFTLFDEEDTYMLNCEVIAITQDRDRMSLNLRFTEVVDQVANRMNKFIRLVKAVVG